MRILLLLPWLMFATCFRAQPAPPYFNAENLRSDTFDLLHYTVSLELGTSVSPTIGGFTSIRLAPKMNGQQFIRFDLLGMTVDSVKDGASHLVFQYNDPLLKINFASAKNVTDTVTLTVFYHGTPHTDASGWGGFYFSNTQSAEYAFNLGVGFAANPHNYGRVWFPCFDNFIERSSYDFIITTDSSRRAYCGGMLISDVVTGNKRTRTWHLQEEIPTYLASVAAARYSEVNWTANTLNGPRPVVIAAHASDTAAAKSAFKNLLNCVAGFENYFGPYQWSRVGYALVPFSGGAMEHAANIAFPRTPALLNSEELMSHELSHHWWGNLVTCETPEDMWINEGMASLSAHLFFEWQYGKQQYLDRIKTQHEDLLHFLHKREGGFLSISGLPHALTYSDHVYKKGAIAGHTLRGYMGDTAFFAACKSLMQQKAFSPVNSNEMRNIMQASSGMNLSDFFNDWIYNGGWPHFSMDSVRYGTQGSTVTAKVAVRQKLFGAAALYKNVPLEVRFFKNDHTSEVRTFTMNGSSALFTFSLTFQPAYCALNYDSKISDATSHDAKYIKNPGMVNFTLGKASVNVQNAGNDSSLLRIIHNYVAPDPFKQNLSGHILSDQRYWRVEGMPGAGFDARLRFVYDGTKNTTGANTYLDTLLTRVNGDSIALFYRKDAGEDWRWLKNVVKVKFGPKQGYLETDSLMTGEYAFANLGDTTITVDMFEPAIPSKGTKVFPNPVTRQVTVEITRPGEETYTLELTDVQGKTVLRKQLMPGSSVVDLYFLPTGIYHLSVKQRHTLLHSTKLLLE